MCESWARATGERAKKKMKGRKGCVEEEEDVEACILGNGGLGEGQGPRSKERSERDTRRAHTRSCAGDGRFRAGAKEEWNKK